MTYFARVPETGSPLKLVLVGAGAMGRVRSNVISEEPATQLVGIIDLDPTLANAAVDELGLMDVAIGSSVTELASVIEVDAVVNVTVPGAHYSVNSESLRLGLPVLCEKPIVPTVAEAIQLAALAEATGQLLMTSQSRRYYRTLFQFGETVALLGDIGMLSTDFHTGPHFGGFRDEMEHPLLLDMAIHAFDAARFVLVAEPVSVYCDAFNPSWSWYRGDACAVAVFEMTGGARYVFTGSWCSQGLNTSWNGSWIARGAHGASSWDGSERPIVDSPEALYVADSASAQPEEMAGSLREFINSLRTGTTPYGNIHSNVWSLAMVQSAVESAESGVKVDVRALVEEAYLAARASSTGDVLARLTSWPGGALGLELTGSTAE